MRLQTDDRGGHDRRLQHFEIVYSYFITTGYSPGKRPFLQIFPKIKEIVSSNIKFISFNSLNFLAWHHGEGNRAVYERSPEDHT